MVVNKLSWWFAVIWAYPSLGQKMAGFYIFNSFEVNFEPFCSKFLPLIFYFLAWSQIFCFLELQMRLLINFRFVSNGLLNKSKSYNFGRISGETQIMIIFFNTLTNYQWNFDDKSYFFLIIENPNQNTLKISIWLNLSL